MLSHSNANISIFEPLIKCSYHSRLNTKNPFYSCKQITSLGFILPISKVIFSPFDTDTYPSIIHIDS